MSAIGSREFGMTHICTTALPGSSFAFAHPIREIENDTISRRTRNLRTIFLLL
jgi:hypothetical protein